MGVVNVTVWQGIRNQGSIVKQSWNYESKSLRVIAPEGTYAVSRHMTFGPSAYIT